MAKKPVSLEALMSAEPEMVEEATAPAPAPAAPRKAKSKPDNVVALQRHSATAPQTKYPAHTSLYLHPNVKRAIAQIGLDFGRKPHDLIMQGVDLMLAQYGKPSAKELANK